jgi:alpha-tubulin suppressor-like RCC1 family protein
LGLGFACAFDKHGFQCWGNPQSQNDGEGGAFNLPPIPTVLNPSIKTHYVAGQKHVCGLDATGVHCWGDNSLGQLDVPPLSHPTQIFADSLSNQTCALDDSGLLCWGEDQAGQSSLSSVSSLSAGIGNTCAAVHGKLECWGNGSKTVGTPIPVSDAYQVSVGSNFACAADVSTNSTFSCWGDNNFLQAGGPPLPTIDYTAGNQLLITSTLFTSGYNHACFYSNQTNGVSCFGNNDFGQSKPPITFISNGGASVLSAGGNHTCGIDALQGLLCWGENEYGESTPPKTLKNPRQVSSGFYHTCALDDNGVSCWGRSSEGETTVPKLVNPRYVQSGGYHTCALDDNGVTCWGENSFGQSTVPSNLVMLGQGRKITALSSGQFHTCAVTQ